MVKNLNTHLVSIIVPVYNVEEFLVDCITSLRQQTYTNIEILLIDDGSTDGSLGLCQAAARQDSRIQVIQQKNTGAASARNQGLDQAQGEYICFVDGDDYVDTSYIEKLVQLIEKSETDIAACNHWSIIEGTDKTAAVKNVDFVQFQGPIRQYYDRLLSETRFHIQMFVWRNIYKRSIFESLRFETGTLIEDIILLMNLYTQPDITIKTNEEPLYYYVQHTNSATRQKKFTELILNTIAFIEQSPQRLQDKLIYKHLNLLKYLPLYRWKKRVLLHPEDARLVKKLQPDYSSFIDKQWLIKLYNIDPRLGVLCDLFVNRWNSK